MGEIGGKEKSFGCRFYGFCLILLVDVLIEALEAGGSGLPFYLLEVLVFFLPTEKLLFLLVLGGLAFI